MLFGHAIFAAADKKLTGIRNSHSKSHTSDRINAVELYPGIELTYLTLTTDHFSVHHAALDHILEIDYCHSGRIGWEMGNGNSVYLGQKDFSLHTLKACADSVISLPNGDYEGLTISIDLRELTDNPPEALSGTGITGTFLYDRFCKNSPITSLAGNEQTESIFSAFYDQPEHLQPAWQKIKVLELLLYLGGLKDDPKNSLTEYQSEQIEIIREIHKQLEEHMDQRFTIESLSKQYLINPTTLKTMFKSVYGTSIAAHMKEHRMERAAKLLRETGLSIAEIAESVGYDSQSRFTAAFKTYWGKLPKDYRND
ncbi:MAG: AraC family transcriptional regulator [Lachnospiraceae bacterium]|nr:AraC family transcriptional regulator [Lachnospiraceae bacterium]